MKIDNLLRFKRSLFLFSRQGGLLVKDSLVSISETMSSGFDWMHNNFLLQLELFRFLNHCGEYNLRYNMLQRILVGGKWIKIPG